MKKHIPSNLRIKALSMAIAAASCYSAPLVVAETLSLEEVVVTGSPSGKQSKMDSSVSVTTVSQDRIDNSVARSTTEIFRSIPGVRSESSAGESNTNISIRGIPVASGGGKFLQLHEDGLPVLQFGDIIVGNADNYISYDWTVKRIEAVKGGTAATLASNSPAGIINFVSKTGEQEGGSVGITSGLDYDSQRIDFEYGSPIGDDWSFHAGGYYREGEGVRETGFNGNKGGQLKLSIKRDFERGHVRVYTKILDDKTSTYLPMPMKANGSSISGFDALTGSNMPRELMSNRTGDGGTGVRNSSIGDGSTVESTVVGGELVLDLDESLTFRDRIRVAKNSGKFFGAFTASLGDATNPAGISGGLPGSVDGLAYASGANAGVVLSASELANLNGNGLIQNVRTFDNDINSLDNFTNDMSLTKSFESFDVTVGYYTASQDVDVDWFWQTYIADVSDDVRLLDAYSGTTQLTTGGLVAYGAPDWGYCCYRNTSLETNLDAFYVAVDAYVNESLSISASVRYDDGEGNGTYAFGSNNAVDFDSDGTLSLAETQAQTVTQATIAGSGYQYDWNYMSYAIGVNYLLSDETALFANVSEGGRVNADRLGDGGFISNGAVAPGAVENTVTQYEFGIKHENEDYGVFATAFYVETEDANSEGTSGASNAAVLRDYEATGLELEVVANLGNVSLFGGFTWTDAEIVGSNDASLIGNTPRRQADLVYSANAVYSWENHSAGLTMVGTSDSYSQDANDYELDAYTYFNAFVKYELSEGFTATLSINNLTDEVGVTEAEENSPATINGEEYVRARSIAGRSTSLALKYEF
jgi:outer membrane receptor protein involved in Fe transport